MRRLALSAFVVLLVASCHGATDVAPIHDLNAIRIAVRVEPSTVMPGATASVVLTLQNSVRRPVEISACPIYFWVQDADGQVVGGSNLMYCVAGTLLYQPLILKPLETKTLAFSWVVGETVDIPAGPYDVLGWVNDPAHRSAPARTTVLCCAARTGTVSR
jgi:hypothetical protein